MKESNTLKNILAKRYLSANGSLLLPLALKWRLVCVMVCSLLAILVLPCLGGQAASAASITLTVPGKLSFSTPADGQLHNSPAAPFSVKSDAMAGYTLKIQSANTDHGNTLKNGSYSLESIAESKDEKDFTLNKWGFKWAKQDGGSSKYLPGPTTGTQIDETSAPNTTANEYTITLGVKVDTQIATGTYSGSFTVQVTAKPIPYTITYNQNTTENVSSLPGADSGPSAIGDVTISSQQPTRANYRFIGWCRGQTTKEGEVDVCRNATSFQAGDHYTLKSSGEAIALNAMWVKETSIMQNWIGCKDATMNQQITLVDIRDNRPYYVAKLADGNCWMTENLDLFLKSDAQHPYTPLDTDVRENWVPKEETHATNDAKWNAELQPNAPGVIYPQSYDAGDFCWKGERTYANDSALKSENYVNCYKHAASHYYIGNYYTYAAAVAQNDTSDHTTSGASYGTSSVCPAGWQLPNAEGDKSYVLLREESDKAGQTWVAGYINEKTAGQDSLKEDTVHRAPFYFVYSGLWRGFYFSIGNRANYRTNAVQDSTNSITLNFYTSGTGTVAPRSTDSWRVTGHSVRCVARDTMQTVTEWGDDITVGESTVAIDERDGNTYQVRRLADGKLWMIDNLRIGDSDFKLVDGARKLTAATSDVTSDWTLPNNGATGLYVAEKDSSSELWKYGGYYDWTVATAGGQTSGSICPKGWRLPTSDDYKALGTALGDSTANWTNKDGASFLFAGATSSFTAAVGQGSNGNYWSSTSRDSYIAYSMHIDAGSNFGTSASQGYKENGYSVRCVAHDTMQNVSEWKDDISVGESAQAIDERDGNVYRVSRLSDGNLWMTQDLRLGEKDKSITLTKDDSDVDSNFNLPPSVNSGFGNASEPQVNVDSVNTPAKNDANGATYGAYYNWNASTVTPVKMSSTSPVICGVITTCPNEIDNPSAKLAGERAKIVREELTTNETIAGTLSLITAPNSAEVIHYWTLKAEFA